MLEGPRVERGIVIRNKNIKIGVHMKIENHQNLIGGGNPSASKFSWKIHSIYLGVWALLLSSLISLQSCIFGGDDDKKSSMNMKDLLKTGYYSMELGKNFQSYFFSQDQGGKLFEREFEWEPDSNKWVENKQTYDLSEVTEDLSLNYTQGSWKQSIRVSSGQEVPATIQYTSGGDWTEKSSVISIVNHLDSSVNISGKKIVTLFTELKDFIPNATVFQSGSSVYYISTKVAEESYLFSKGKRSCDTADATTGQNQNLTCPDKPWTIEADSGFASFTEFRNQHSSVGKEFEMGDLKIRFILGSNEIEIWAADAFVDGELQYKLLAKRGSWIETTLGNKPLQMFTFPAEAPVFTYFGLAQNCLVLDSSKVYSGYYFKKGNQMSSLDFEQLAFNEKAIQSILSVFSAPKLNRLANSVLKKSASSSSTSFLSKKEFSKQINSKPFRL